MSDGTMEGRIVTVLFAGLLGFTSRPERRDPEDPARVQRGCRDASRVSRAAETWEALGVARRTGVAMPEEEREMDEIAFGLRSTPKAGA